MLIIKQTVYYSFEKFQWRDLYVKDELCKGRLSQVDNKILEAYLKKKSNYKFQRNY